LLLAQGRGATLLYKLFVDVCSWSNSYSRRYRPMKYFFKKL
jgi:hypothetical protein